jgi:hypothetical protein
MRRRRKMETKRIKLHVRSLRDDDIEEHVRLLKGVDRFEFEGNEDKESFEAVLMRVGSKLWQARDRDNPGVLDEVIAEICEACDCDFSGMPVMGRHETLTPKKDGMGGPHIGVWVSGNVDVSQLGGALEKMKGVRTVETI